MSARFGQLAELVCQDGGSAQELPLLAERLALLGST
jgi:hypothetical protein